MAPVTFSPVLTVAFFRKLCDIKFLRLDKSILSVLEKPNIDDIASLGVNTFG
jgi:hypothetical protein